MQVGFLHIRSVDAIRHPIYYNSNIEGYYYIFHNKMYFILIDLSQINGEITIILSKSEKYSDFLSDYHQNFGTIYINNNPVLNIGNINIPENLI